MLKSVMRSPVIIAALFVVAVALLGFGTVGAVQAAPRIQSADYRAEVVLTDIETALTENGDIVEGDDTLLHSLVPKGQKFAVGKTYDEVLAVRNVGAIDEYVRVTVSLFWEDASGKRVNLDPSYIQLHFVEGDGWTIDTEASTPERTVLYYATPISPGDDTTPFADTLRIDSKVLTEVTATDDGDVYDYSKDNGVKFRIKAVADAVQTHNGEAAMTGAWGRTV